MYGNSLRSQLVAVVVPDPEYLLPWAKERGLSQDLKQVWRASHRHMHMHTHARARAPARRHARLHASLHPTQACCRRMPLSVPQCVLFCSEPPAPSTLPACPSPTRPHPPQLCGDTKVTAAVFKSMLEEGRAAGLKGFEQVGGGRGGGLGIGQSQRHKQPRGARGRGCNARCAGLRCAATAA